MITKKVSVIIPCLNRATLLIRALESVYAQTYNVDEVIVIDDFSNFHLRNYIPYKLQERTIFIRNNKRMNAAFSRNQGIKIANGNIIAFLDSDDYWHTDHIKLSLIEMERQQVSLLFGKFYSISSDAKKMILPRNAPANQFQIPEYLFMQKGFINTSTFVGTRKFIRSIMFDNNLKKHQDWDFIIRASLRSGIGFLDTPTAYLDRSTTDRMSNTSNISASLYFIKKHQNIFSEEVTKQACKRIIRNASNIPEFRTVITFYKNWNKFVSRKYFILILLYTIIISILSPFPRIMKAARHINSHLISLAQFKYPSS